MLAPHLHSLLAPTPSGRQGGGEVLGLSFGKGRLLERKLFGMQTHILQDDAGPSVLSRFPASDPGLRLQMCRRRTQCSSILALAGITES